MRRGVIQRVLKDERTDGQSKIKIYSEFNSLKMNEKRKNSCIAFLNLFKENFKFLTLLTD
jgi:hypothetical protein